MHIHKPGNNCQSVCLNYAAGTVFISLGILLFKLGKLPLCAGRNSDNLTFRYENISPTLPLVGCKIRIFYENILFHKHCKITLYFSSYQMIFNLDIKYLGGVAFTLTVTFILNYIYSHEKV